MATFLNDTFTGTNATALTAHTGETGATWAYGYTATPAPNPVATINANRAYWSGSNTPQRIIYASGTPATADYDVVANVHYFTNAGTYQGIGARLSTTLYQGYFMGIHAGVWKLRKLSGPFSVSDLATGATPSTGSDHELKMVLRGTSIKGYIDGSLVFNVADGTYSGAGKVGLVVYQGGGTSATLHYTDISANDPVPPGAYCRFDGADWITEIPYVKAGGSFAQHAATVKL